MALREVVSGTLSDISRLTVPCKRPVLWTIQVKNANVTGSPNIAGTPVTVKVGATDYQLSTDENGYITLVFDPGDRPSVVVSVTHAEHRWTGQALQAQAGSSSAEADRYQSNAPIEGTWRLQARVLQAGLLPSQETPMKIAPLHLSWGTTVNDPQATRKEGGAYRKPDIPCLTDYVIKVPDPVGADPAKSTVKVKIGNAAVDVSTADQAVSKDGVTVRRTASNDLHVHVDRHGAAVIVDFVLQFSWTVRVTVKDRGPRGAMTAPTLLTQVPLTLQWDTSTLADPRTGDDGSPYVKAGLLMDTDYTIAIPDTYGANSVVSTAEVSVDGGRADVATADTPVARGAATITRTAANAVKVRAARGVRAVEVTFLVRFAWKVRVTVADATSKADATPIRGTVLKMCEVPVTLATSTASDKTPRTKDDGSAYENNDLLLGTTYTISLPETYGDIATKRAAEVTVDGETVDVATADTPVVKRNVTVTRTALNAVTVNVNATRACPLVDVTLKLQYPKVFIVGEGPLFPYAIGLARRYAKGEKKATRTLPPRADTTADDTPLSDERKWIIASQFDVHADPTGTLPRTLYVYRDAVNRDFGGNLGCFDVRKAACWNRLTTLQGLLDACIFNNPHPGYGMHRCDVFGLRAGNTGKPGKYISVHTLGYGPTLTGTQVNRFRTDGKIVQRGTKWVKGSGPTLDMEQAANQRAFVQRVLNYVGAGASQTSDFDDGGGATPQAIGTAFTPLQQATVAFGTRVTHYREQIGTIGLWGSILRCYRINGNGALNAGGALYLHGSKNFENVLGGGQYLDGFAALGTTWAATGTAGNVYYANYATNFTSDTFHPSWFAEVTFGPGEPGLGRAQCYKRDKT